MDQTQKMAIKLRGSQNTRTCVWSVITMKLTISHLMLEVLVMLWEVLLKVSSIIKHAYTNRRKSIIHIYIGTMEHCFSSFSKRVNQFVKPFFDMLFNLYKFQYAGLNFFERYVWGKFWFKHIWIHLIWIIFLMTTEAPVLEQHAREYIWHYGDNNNEITARGHLYLKPHPLLIPLLWSP